MQAHELTDTDRRQLEQRGISVEEAERQLGRFEARPAYVRLVRPCTLGDGIESVPDERVSELHELHAAAAASGRFVKFVPASGAASRMFRELLHFHHGAGRASTWESIVASAERGETEASALIEFVGNLPRFAFHEDLARALPADGPDLEKLARVGEYLPILDALLGTDGLGYSELPKGLLKFHRDDEGGRTAFEEHLFEAAHYVRDREGGCRLHFTVSLEHRERFETLFRQLQHEYERRYAARLEVGWSMQKPSTDTLAVDMENRPLRDAEGRLVFRPGGHGALIQNLDDLGADLVYIKNIDNVQPDRLKETTLRWKRLLGGYLVELQRNAHASIERLRASGDNADIGGLGSALHVELNGGRPKDEARRRYLIDRLDRPLRVCGVVPSTGEPGGGPFWVRGTDGAITTQIVESAQVDPADERQQQIFDSSTHFNPVDLVCAVRDPGGSPYDLQKFIDHETAIVTRKSSAGREIKALERPGLWNGAMSAWNTVFVEVPLPTFSPVKTLLDLLRPEHL